MSVTVVRKRKKRTTGIRTTQRKIENHEPIAESKLETRSQERKVT